MNNISYCAIAIFLPEEYAKTIVQASKKLGEFFNSWFILDSEIFPAHITIWIAYIPNHNLSNIIKDVAEVALKQQTFNVLIDNINIQKSGYISFNVAQNDSLRKLHDLLLLSLNKWREGFIHEKYLKKINEYTIDQQESIKQFGTRMAGRFFNPHITIGVINPQHITFGKEILPYDLVGKKFEVQEIVFFRQAEEGKSIEILKKFDLYK